jgi:hypothetical protein
MILTQEYVDKMLTTSDQCHLKANKSKGYAFGNNSSVIIWEVDHFEEISYAAYQNRVWSHKRTNGFFN